MACLISSTTIWVSARMVFFCSVKFQTGFVSKPADHKVQSRRCKGIAPEMMEPFSVVVQ